MRSPDYTRLAAQLPPVYQDDVASYQQVDAYLGLADELAEATIEALEDAGFSLGPDAALRWPSELPLDAGSDALIASLLESYDAVAESFAFRFPSSWGADEAAVLARRRFTAKAARLWRRRGTPRGFVDWFCTYFALEEQQFRPFLLEHFKVPGGVFDAEPFTATLFVPNSATFVDYRRRLEAADFARWYAPAHVFLRVCFVPVGFLDTLLPLATPVTLAPGADQAAVDAYRLALVDHAQLLRELACSVVSVVDHANGIHIYGCPAPDGPPPERPIDHLDIGKLPTEGD